MTSTRSPTTTAVPSSAAVSNETLKLGVVSDVDLSPATPVSLAASISIDGAALATSSITSA